MGSIYGANCKQCYISQPIRNFQVVDCLVLEQRIDLSFWCPILPAAQLEIIPNIHETDPLMLQT